MFCGFNNEMLDGLDETFQGITKQAGQPATAVIQDTIRLLKEKDDLYYDVLRPKLGVEAGIKAWVESFKDEPLDPQVLRGCMLFAKGLYLQAFKRAEEDHCSLEESYRSEIDEMTAALKAMDEVFVL